MSDVAAASGVSLKTVSRVVNGVGYVSAETLQTVQAAIEQLGFRRNEFARQLRQGRAATIGLVLEDVADPFYSVLTRAVEDVALEHDYLLLSASSAEDPVRSRRIIESFSSRGADGLIIAPAAAPNRRSCRPRSTPDARWCSSTGRHPASGLTWCSPTIAAVQREAPPT